MARVSRLRVCTFNVWGHPDWLTRHGSLRMRAIGDALEGMDVDILAVQELWTRRRRSEFIEAAARAGLRHVWHNPAAFGGSGLAILSRERLGAIRFESFALRGLPQRIQHGDYWGGKGFAIARVVTKAGEIALLDTHLQAQYAPDAQDEYRPQRVGQMVEIAAALRSLRTPVVALGDFNTREGRPEYQVLTGLAGLRDAAVELDRRQPTVLEGNPYRIGTGGEALPEQRIDYVFLRDGASASLRVLSVERVFDGDLSFGGDRGAYSDHAGLWAELEIDAAEGVAPAARPVSQSSLDLARAALSRGGEQARGRQRGQRAVAGGGLLAALLAGAKGRDSRRGFLRGLSRGVGLACLSAGAAAGLLSEYYAPAERKAFARVARQLDVFSTSS